MTILAGQDWVKPSGTEVPDFDQRPTSQTFEAETYGRKNPGNGGGDGRDVRAFGAQVAEWPVTVGDEIGGEPAKLIGDDSAGIVDAGQGDYLKGRC